MEIIDQSLTMSIDNREEAVILLFFFNDSFLFQWFNMADLGEIVNERTKKSRGARNDSLYSRNIIKHARVTGEPYKLIILLKT